MSQFVRPAMVLLLYWPSLCCQVVSGLAKSSGVHRGGAKTWTHWPPHSGYHGGGADPNKAFFEGWYLRLITQNQGSIALIFHIFDPHLPQDGATASSSRRGVGMQVLTPHGTTRVESSDLSKFHAASHKLDVRNYFHDIDMGNNEAKDYFRLNTNGASGCISSDSDRKIEFDFEFMPEVGWGTPERQYSVAGFLAAFPVFEPHYQVLVSRGRCPRGFLSVQGEDQANETNNAIVYDLTNATIYLEKNWGGSFPSKWWWIQGHTFAPAVTAAAAYAESGQQHRKRHPLLDLCVTSTGGRRRIPLLPSNQQEEEVGLVGLHWNGKFLPFPDVEWKVGWGQWTVQGSYGRYVVELEGKCDEKGFPVNCPTLQGMEEIALETFRGTLRIKLYERQQGDDKLTQLLDAVDHQVCLEIGGLPWTERVWKGKSSMKEPLKSVVMNEDLEMRASNILTLVSCFIEIPGL